MRRLWSVDELGEHWTLLPDDLALLTDLPDTGKLGLVGWPLLLLVVQSS
jgi:hypothetical protein